MKQDFPKLGIAVLCRLFGRTRHAYYDSLWRKESSLVKEDVILQEVINIRKNLPRLGTRKLNFLIKNKLISHQISFGRDYLFDLLSEHKLLIRQRKRKAMTTDSRHWMRKYSNLIKDIEITRPEQVWVSDITYIMALNNRIYNQSIIHHSDRGSQYCSHNYVDLLLKNNIAISMTENGDPYENALAERVNGIIKTEFNLYSSLLGFEQTRNQISRSIKSYNELRPHASCDYLTPNQAHLQSDKLNKRWKNYNKSFYHEKTIV
jgi:hypothetical protein